MRKLYTQRQARYRNSADQCSGAKGGRLLRPHFSAAAHLFVKLQEDFA